MMHDRTKLALVVGALVLMPRLATASDNRFTLTRSRRITVTPSQVPPTPTRCLFDRVGRGEPSTHLEIRFDPHEGGAPLARGVVLGKGTWQVTFHSDPQPHPVQAGIDTAWTFDAETAYSGVSGLGTAAVSVVAKIRRCTQLVAACTPNVPIALEATDLPTLGAAAASLGRADPSRVDGHAGGRSFASDATTLTNDLLGVIADVAVDRFESQAMRAATARLREQLGCDDRTRDTAKGGSIRAPSPLAASKLDRILALPGRLAISFPATCSALDAIRLRDLASAGPALERAVSDDLVRATSSVALRAIASSIDAWPSSDAGIVTVLDGAAAKNLGDAPFVSRDTLVAILRAARDYVDPNRVVGDEQIAAFADPLLAGALDPQALSTVHQVLDEAWSRAPGDHAAAAAAVLAVVRSDGGAAERIRKRGAAAIAAELQSLGARRVPPARLTREASLDIATKLVAFTEGTSLDASFVPTLAAAIAGERGAAAADLLQVGQSLPAEVVLRGATDAELFEAFRLLVAGKRQAPAADPELLQHVATLRSAIAPGTPLDPKPLAALARRFGPTRPELVQAVKRALIRSVLLDVERVADAIAAARRGKIPAELAATMLQAIRQTALAFLAVEPGDRSAAGLAVAVAALAAIQDAGRFDAALARDMLLHPGDYFQGVRVTPGPLTPALERFVAGGAELVLPAKGTTDAEMVRRAIALYLDALAILAEGAPDASTLVATLEQLGRVADAMLARDNATILVAALELFRLHEDTLSLPWGTRGATATRALAAVTSYAATYAAPLADDPGGKLRAAQRKQAVESIVEMATDRSERATRHGSDAVVSLGVQVDALVNSYRDLPSTTSRAVLPRLSLPLGLALQQLWSPYCGYHLQLSFLDLGQYVAYTGKQERTDARWDTALVAGGQIGFAFGNFQNPFVVAFDLRFAPGLFSGIEGRGAGAYSVGASIGMYVPLLDFN
jgi:hypothetical protein